MTLNQRGAALGIVIISAVIFSIMAYAVLAMSLSKAQLADYPVDRARAHYAAEAGVVWAREQLWNDSAFCANSNPDLTMNGLDVDVQISSCGTPGDHEIRATVSF